VHPYDTPPDPAAPERLTHALPVDVALGRVAYLEVLGFSDHRATADVWYRLLNTGFRIPAGAGTDAMANFASLRGPVGLNRVYVRADRLEYRAWLDGLVAGRTFVTNGPLLAFRLRDVEAGATLPLGAGRHELDASVWMRSIVPVDSIEIVSNGRVVHRITPVAGGTAADARIRLPVTESAWFTLRTWSARATHPTLDIYPFATTSPIYVTVGGRPVRSPEDARFFVRWIDGLLREAGAHTGWNDDAERRRVLDALRRARAVFMARTADGA
jgi:hypothetical protein